MFKYRRTRKAPKLSEYNKLQRYIWCLKHEHTNSEDYVFADETAIRILEVPLYHTRRKGERPQAICKTTKIRLKLNLYCIKDQVLFL